MFIALITKEILDLGRNRRHIRETNGNRKERRKYKNSAYIRNHQYTYIFNGGIIFTNEIVFGTVNSVKALSINNNLTKTTFRKNSKIYVRIQPKDPFLLRCQEKMSIN